MEPTFPLRTAPACQQCRQPCTREQTSAYSTNGNANRFYFTCFKGDHPRKFCTFDDNQGITKGNPTCYCGYIGRWSKRNDGDGWYGCPIGVCRWSQSGYASDNTWSRESTPTWSGNTMPEVAAGGYGSRIAVPAAVAGRDWSRESTPDTHTAVSSADLSYTQYSSAPEVANPIAYASKSMVIQGLREAPATPVATVEKTYNHTPAAVNYDSHAYESDMRYGNRRRFCCAVM